MKAELNEDATINELLAPLVEADADADPSSPAVVAEELRKAQEQLTPATATVPPVDVTPDQQHPLPNNDHNGHGDRVVLSSGSSGDFVFPSSREEIESLDEDQFPKLVDACKSHPKFPVYRKNEYNEIGEDQAEFGDPNVSDPLEDVIGFCEFLKGVADTKSDAPVTAPAIPESPQPPPPTVELSAETSQPEEPPSKKQKVEPELEPLLALEDALDNEVEKSTVPSNLTQSAAVVAARLSQEVQDSAAKVVDKSRHLPRAPKVAEAKPKGARAKKGAKQPVPASQSISAAMSRAAKATRTK